MKIPFPILLFCLFFLLLGHSFAQEPQFVESILDEEVEIRGDLSEGFIMDDLSWAWSAQNACFPATQQHKFNGNHVLYATQMPARTEMEIEVIPDDPSANLSIYAYEVWPNREQIVPRLRRCFRCEVDHQWDGKWVGREQDHTRTVDDLIAFTRPYTTIFGIVGAEGLSEGSYTVIVRLRSL